MLACGRACGQAAKRRLVAPASVDAESLSELEIWQQILRLLHAALKKLGTHMTAHSCSLKLIHAQMPLSRSHRTCKRASAKVDVIELGSKSQLLAIPNML